MRTHIMLHHSATADGKTFSWNAIERFHTSYRHGGDIITEQGYYSLKAQGVAGLSKPWLDIGYHAGVELTDDGVAAMLGRDWLKDAAACAQDDMNQKALHVCIVGNYDNAPPSDEHLRVLVQRVLLPWMALFNIPAYRIIGHRQSNPGKTCPGVLFDVERVRRMIP